MRVISGKFKGRSLLVPGQFKGRPTTDFGREGLFNVLQNQMAWEETRVLELFAGTGAFGVECASRGARQITSIEIHSLHTTWIRKNHDLFEMKGARIMQMDVFKFLKNETTETYDLIFADPPFDLAGVEQLPDLIQQGGWLQPNGLFVLEHAARLKFDDHKGFIKSKKYANVNFSFFEFPPAV
jgi:16S rRNA (guanine(966)-N(2))-methyltransferase RsmD